MGKSTIVLVTLAALGLGALIGLSLIDEEDAGATVGGPSGPITAITADTGGAPTFRFLSPDSVTVTLDEFDRPAPVANGENFIERDGILKTEILTIELASDAVTEYKAVMKQGDSIAFRWTTDGGAAYYDFHAHDAAFGDEFFTRYAEGEGTGNAGSIVAAYDGQHGWFWLNIEGEPITITLEVMGFYEEIIKIDMQRY